MPYKLIIKEEARQDIQHAYSYYEEQQKGLGERFLTMVQKRLMTLSEHPQYYSYIDKKQILRDITIENFPFVAVFEISGNEVTVYAICSTYRKTEFGG